MNAGASLTEKKIEEVEDSEQLKVSNKKTLLLPSKVWQIMQFFSVLLVSENSKNSLFTLFCKNYYALKIKIDSNKTKALTLANSFLCLDKFFTPYWKNKILFIETTVKKYAKYIAKKYLKI